MARRTVRGHVQRFPGKNGWYYLPLGKQLQDQLEARVRATWPALIKVNCTIGATSWRASIMPIKDGPLFIALPVKVRKAEGLELGDRIAVTLDIGPAN